MPLDAATSLSSFSSAKKSQPPIANFFLNQHGKSLPVVFSRLTTLGLTALWRICTSAELRTSHKARGCVVPKSAMTLRNMVVKYANTIRETVMKLKNSTCKPLIDLESKTEITDTEFDSISSGVACLVITYFMLEIILYLKSAIAIIKLRT